MLVVLLKSASAWICKETKKSWRTSAESLWLHTIIQKKNADLRTFAGCKQNKMMNTTFRKLVCGSFLFDSHRKQLLRCIKGKKCVFNWSKWYLEAIWSIWGILRRFSCVELRIAAEEDPLQFAADRWPVAAAVVFHWWQHEAGLSISGTVRGAVHSTHRVKTQLDRWWTAASEGFVEATEQDAPVLLEVLPLLVSVEDCERQHPASDRLCFPEQLVQVDGGVIWGHTDSNVTLLQAN